MSAHGSKSLLAVLAFAGGLASSDTLRAENDPYESLAVFARVLAHVQNHHASEVDARALVYGAIRGMLATLDSHSVFMDPEQFAALRREALGEFGGIGIEIVKRGEGAVIVETHEATPAARAGLGAGDTIVSVEHAAVRDLSLAEAVARIKGPPGTSVSLGLRTSDGLSREVTLVRETIRALSVDSRSLGAGIGYLRVRTFSEGTAREASAALAKLSEGGGLEGLVLDLRDNPGGLLEEAVQLADAWLEGGTIVSTVGRNRPSEEARAHPKGTEPSYPLVVLVNGGTASAAEIVAGALQDHGRGLVLGTQTFGKGSVQTVIELEDHSAIKLTIARYFTPKHRSIQGTGITPDEIVPVAGRELGIGGVGDGAAEGAGAMNRDAQLMRAIERLGRPQR